MGGAYRLLFGLKSHRAVSDARRLDHGPEWQELSPKRVCRRDHVLVYDSPRGSTDINMEVEAELPKGAPVRQVTLLTPDGEKAAGTVPSRPENGQRGHGGVTHHHLRPPDGGN